MATREVSPTRLYALWAISRVLFQASRHLGKAVSANVAQRGSGSESELVPGNPRQLYRMRWPCAGAKMEILPYTVSARLEEDGGVRLLHDENANRLKRQKRARLQK
jgi:hypothetical protein